jgi:hypothetical protein
LRVDNRPPVEYGSAELVDNNGSGVQERPAGVQVVDHKRQEPGDGRID